MLEFLAANPLWSEDPVKNDPFGARTPFTAGPGQTGHYYSLPALEKAGLGAISRLPVSIRIVLESVLRNLDGERIREQDVRALAGWKPSVARTDEVPFIVGRVLLQDFTGVPLLVDLAAMRSAVKLLSKEPKLIEPLVPVDLVIDHSVQVDYAGNDAALARNMQMEFDRNRARYEFLKWGMGAFDGFQIVPPGIGICHQVNLEYLAKGVIQRGGAYYPDSLVGTDSHTTMINGVGVVGWGVGGIEAEAGMLGQPVYFLTPDVVGVHMSGKLGEGVTATDLVLTVTEMLRKAKVVGKFVEFHGEGAASLPATDRATIANMAPEYGATMGFFPVDEQTLRYFTITGRNAEHVQMVRAYYEAQGLFGMPKRGQCDYTTVLDLDLGSIRASVAGPKRPQDRIELPALKSKFRELLEATEPAGYGKRGELDRRVPVSLGPAGGQVELRGGGSQDSSTVPADRLRNTNPATETEMVNNRPTPNPVPNGNFPRVDVNVGHGDIVIAAITSCTNTSNPSVMIAAGLLAKKAAERGLRVPPHVKTSLAPGSRVVTAYLEKTGLMPHLARVGFQVVGYGCTTCIGNSGPLEPHLEEAITKNDLVAAAVLSGNRNFEARVHQNVKANFLMSPPLVVAFALAGRIDIDLASDPIGTGEGGKPVHLKDIWPKSDEITALLAAASDPATYRERYSNLGAQTPLWTQIAAPQGLVYNWDRKSTYVQEPPYFEAFRMDPTAPAPVRGARALAIFGDSVTTDHISPAGSIKPSSPAGLYLQQQGVPVAEFNSYGARRGNHEVMVRGTFANVRIKNLMMPGTEGGVTALQPEGQRMSIFDASIEYQKMGTPLVVIAGHEYGTGSSRDWAAKGTRLLGVGAVIARSFERIHRSNLIGMGVLPCQFAEGTSAQTLNLDGSEVYELAGIAGAPKPQQEAKLVVQRRGGAREEVPVRVRIDTPIEVQYYIHGGILPYVLRQLVRA
jgi:aconitate hydratase